MITIEICIKREIMLNEPWINDVLRVKSNAPSIRVYADHNPYQQADTRSALQNSEKLYPSLLDAGLLSAIEGIVAELQRQTQAPCTFRHNLNSVEIDHDIATTLLKITQEACINIREHAHATSVDIYLYGSDNELQLEIIDNGCGIPNDKRFSSKSLGLQTMRDLSAEQGGRILIATENRKGTLISVSVPHFSHA
jgi:signal transduction histidine kinase